MSEKNTKNNNLNQDLDNFTKAYRPDCLGDVIGQESVIEILLNSILYNQIPSSTLLAGEKGTGKTSTARAYAKTINCQNLDKAIEPLRAIIRENPDAKISLEDKKKIIRPCGECLACQEFKKDSQFAGVIEFDAGSEGKIEEVRNLKEQLRYTGNFKYKVAIIDESHNMSNGGNTALLKIIEEPPKHVIFMFATTHPDNMLPTIKSRSMILKFNGVDDDEIEARLNFIANKEKIKIEDNALKAIASSTNGGVRDAIKNLEQVSLKCKGRTITVNDLLDIVDIEPEYVSKLIDLMLNGTIDSLLIGLKNTFSNRKISIENNHLDYFISKIRDMMYTLKSKDERTMIKEVYKIFISGKERFMYNVSATTVLETCILEAFDLIEEYKSKQSTVNQNYNQNINNISSNNNPNNSLGQDQLVISKTEIFTKIFKLMFPVETCNIVFNGVDIAYVESKNSICFFVPNEERGAQIKEILRTDLAQSIKSTVDSKGFLLKIKNN